MKGILQNHKIILKQGSLIAYPYNQMTQNSMVYPYGGSDNFGKIHKNLYMWPGQCTSQQICEKNGYYAVKISYGTKTKTYGLQNEAISFDNYMVLDLNYNDDFLEELIDMYYGSSPKVFKVELINHNTNYNLNGSINFAAQQTKPKAVFKYKGQNSPENGLTKSTKTIDEIVFDTGYWYSAETKLFTEALDKLIIYIKEYKEETTHELTSYQQLDFSALPDELFVDTAGTNTVTIVCETYYKYKNDDYHLIWTDEKPLSLYNF